MSKIKKAFYLFKAFFVSSIRSSVMYLFRTRPMSNQFGFDRGTPVDRYYIEKFLYNNRQYFKGRMLEVAEDLYATRFARLNETRTEEPEVETLHYDGTGGDVTIIGDLTKPETLPENSYDCFVCTQVYMFIFDVVKALEGSYHLLKEGGVLLATVAGISQVSREDMNQWGDYWRFTNKSLEFLFKETKFSYVEIVSMGNVMASCAFLQGMALEELPQRELLDEMDENYQLIIGIKAVK